jgi:hypothetical protein
MNQNVHVLELMHKKLFLKLFLIANIRFLCKIVYSFLKKSTKSVFEIISGRLVISKLKFLVNSNVFFSNE